MRWEPNRDVASLPWAAPSYGAGLRRGLANHCPCCGQGTVFKPGLRNWLKVVDKCEHCRAPLGELRADDAPPYFTILLTGHLLVPLIFVVERAYEPAMWIHMALWLPLFTIACTVLLRPIKGAVVGWMCALGFESEAEAPMPVTIPARPTDA